MQLTLAQLRKLSFPYTCEESLDLSKELDGFEDIKSSSLVNVKTTIRERGIDTYLLKFEIHVELVLEDAVSLKDIPYTINTEAEEIFSTDDEIEDAFLIEGMTLNTKEAILTNILCEKPMSFTKEEFVSDSQEVEEEDNINPAFASLKDLL